MQMKFTYNQVGNDLQLQVIQDGEDNYFQYCTNGNDSNCKDVDGNAHGTGRRIR